jgi:RNA polymerase sigma-70 factor (ECF subfamily)
MNLSIEQVEDRVREGDANALVSLLELYRPRLLNFVQNLMSKSLRQKVDPEDVVQEVCLSCVKSFPELDLVDRNPFDWVCQVARRRIIDQGRKYSGTEKRAVNREVGMSSGSDDQATFAQMLVASITSPSSAFSRDQREFRLQHAIEQLPQENRDALRMRYVESLSSKEIAERLNKSDGAIRVLLTRSLKRLHSLMGDP